MTREQFIDKACRWLVEHSHNSDTQDGTTCTPIMTDGTLIEDFRKAMTEKTNPIFERCLAKVSPEVRAEVRKNMDVALVWHKASEELPKYEVAVIVAYNGSIMDCCFNHRSSNPEVKTTKNGWCDVGYDGEPTYWMEIPELPKEG